MFFLCLTNAGSCDNALYSAYNVVYKTESFVFSTHGTRPTISSFLSSFLAVVQSSEVQRRAVFFVYRCVDREEEQIKGEIKFENMTIISLKERDITFCKDDVYVTVRPLRSCFARQKNCQYHPSLPFRARGRFLRMSCLFMARFGKAAVRTPTTTCRTVQSVSEFHP